MIVRTGEADRFTERPPADLFAALIFGPDAGLVRERADRLAKSVVDDLSDPFRVAELDEGILASDPARLSDEAAALSMTGGKRVVRVRGAGNALAGIFESLLENPPSAPGVLVVAEGGDLAKSASLRKLFEGASQAAAIACYPDQPRDIAGVVRDALKAEGLSIEADALEDTVSRLGSDRGVTRRELEKLALYARGEKIVTRRHIQAIMGDESELRMDDVCDAAGEGDFVRLDRALARLWPAGLAPAAVVRAALGHFQRLALVRAEADEGGDVALAMKKLRPPPHFSREKSFRTQLQRLSLPKIEDGLAALYEAEALVKTTGVPGEAVVGRALFSVAALARLR
jgi:DNA polymerase-3 subunit delta